MLKVKAVTLLITKTKLTAISSTYACVFIYASSLPNSLRVGRSTDRIPVIAKFPAPIHADPGAYPASYTMGTGSFPGIRRLGRGVDHLPPSSADVNESVEYTLTPLLGLHGLI